jgi:capsular exopolysaccharide synthesis family protein
VGIAAPSGLAPDAAAAAADDEAVRDDRLIQEYRSRMSRVASALASAKRLARAPSDPSVRGPQEELRRLAALLREREVAVRLAAAQDRGQQNPTRTDPAGDLTALEDRVKVLREMERLVAADVKKLDGSAGEINHNSMSLETVQNEIAIADAAAKRVGNEVEALNVELEAPSRVRLIEQADTPRPASDSRLRSAALAAAAVLALSAGFVSMVEFRARRVGSVDEVVQGLGLRLIGTLPALPRRPSRLDTRQDAARVPPWHIDLIEAVDNARTNLLLSTAAGPFRSVTVTSAVGGEGKTSLACNLATSMARAGLRTLLIDGDLRSPDVHGVFDLTACPGLSEVLRGEADVARVVHPAAVRNLWVVPAGLCDEGALLALAGDGLRVTLEWLKGRFDFVVVDAPPVLPIADAVLIARHTDAAVQAVLNGASTLPAVYAAHERLQSLGVRTLGVVVAGVPVAGDGRYDYHRVRKGPAAPPGDE